MYKNLPWVACALRRPLPTKKFVNIVFQLNKNSCIMV